MLRTTMLRTRTMVIMGSISTWFLAGSPMSLSVSVKAT